MFVVKELMMDSVLQSTVHNMTSNVMPYIAAAEVLALFRECALNTLVSISAKSPKRDLRTP